jgi:predicted  nucleic acid-binding Zn-ribbon protein
VSYADHDHRGEYASDNHDHYDYAERHHRHYDDESTARGLREDLSLAEARISDLEQNLRDALNRIHVLEDQQPDYEGK